jgi:VIT1/CCC1 family predicted Fe2+/Mn2+ transporter
MARQMGTHKTERIGWQRAAVLGTNDGIVSTASLLMGRTSFTLKKGRCWMKRGILITLVAFAQVANGQTAAHLGEIPTEEDCLAYIAYFAHLL